MPTSIDPRLTRALFEEQYIQLGHTDEQIAKMLRLSKAQVIYARWQLGVEGIAKGRKRKYDVGVYQTKFGELVAFEKFKKGRLWFFRCLCHCGLEFEPRVTHVGGGKTSSCGCVRMGNSRRNLWKGHGEISGDYWSTVRRHASDRVLTFNITIQDTWELFIDQVRSCALSGTLLTFTPEQTASLDRIDSKKGYELGNVQWVHKRINKMKNNLSQEEFIEWCIRVAKTKG